MITNVTKYIKNHVSTTEDKNYSFDLTFGERKEGRTTNGNWTEALRMRIHDPLWMLSRQWQMGEFRGNDTGSAMSVKCRIKEDDCQQDPLEPVVERINPEIDLMARIESAVYFMDLIRHSGMKTRSEIKLFREMAMKTWPIEWESCNPVLGHEATLVFEQSLNSRQQSFVHTYRGKIFDGYKLYEDITSVTKKPVDMLVFVLDSRIKYDYVTWFEKKYFPADSVSPYWQQRDLCYQLSAEVGNNELEGDRYQGGRLSWYSMDYKATKKKGISKTVERDVMSLPTLARFAAAPNRRLWEIEDRKVFMGNSLQQQSGGHIAMIKYATMFSNDWMLFPLDTEIGKYIQLDSIKVIDTFGDEITIDGNDRAGKKDKVKATEERWQLFTNTQLDDPKKTPMDGLYYAPQLANTLEGKPIEEVKILRDEMSNMVWGVEEKVSDGCGLTLDAGMCAAKLTEFVDGLYEANHPKPEPKTVVLSQGQVPEVREEEAKAAYRYLLQSKVPLNWIPFVPQRMKSDSKNPFILGGREMILRRGKMPCYLWNEKDGQVQVDKVPARPMGSILKEGLVKENGQWKEKPLFFHEEAIQSTGIRLIKNYQRARWINGATYQWLGVYKQLAKIEATSGLEFDTLTENK